MKERLAFYLQPAWQRMNDWRLIAPVTEIMMLGGAKVRGGDLRGALEVLGLKIVPDEEVWRDRPGAIDYDLGVELDGLVHYRDCPKCGRPQMCLNPDLVDHEAGWWHDDDGGVRRACPTGNV